LTQPRGSSTFFSTVFKEGGNKISRRGMFYPDLGQEIGRYEPDKGKGFGNLTGSYYGFGNKYLPKYNDNPPPGYYQPGPGFDVTNPKSTSAHIRVPNGYKVYRDDNPDAG